MGAAATHWPEHEKRTGRHKLLKIGYTTIDQALAKGVVDLARPDTISLYHNYGEFFDEVLYFVPFGKKEDLRRLTHHISYEERTPSATTLTARFWHLLRTRARLRSIMHEFNPSVIEICGPHIPAFIGLLTFGVRSYPTVCFLEAYWEDILAQQSYMPRLLRRLLPTWYRFVYRAFDVYVGTPSLEPKYYLKRGMDVKRIARWVQEIDLRIINAVRPTAAAALSGLQEPLICLVGRLHPEKLARDAIEAFCQSATAGGGGSLVIVGDGSERQQLEEIVARAGLGERVVFLGQLPSACVLGVMKRCELMLAPMQGTALLEALATGLAVVAYDHETHRAHIRNDENGLLVPHRDIGAMADTLSELTDNPGHRRRLASAARKYVETNFSFEKMFDVMNDGFRVALALPK